MPLPIGDAEIRARHSRGPPPIRWRRSRSGMSRPRITAPRRDQRIVVVALRQSLQRQGRLQRAPGTLTSVMSASATPASFSGAPVAPGQQGRRRWGALKREENDADVQTRHPSGLEAMRRTGMVSDRSARMGCFENAAPMHRAASSRASGALACGRLDFRTRSLRGRSRPCSASCAAWPGGRIAGRH